MAIDTVVLVHGFLSSSETFAVFSADLRRSQNVASTASVIHYDYPTRGDNSATVTDFVRWLRSQARNGSVRGRVALVGHSMGGLLCVDACRVLCGDMPNSGDDDAADSLFFITHVLALDSPFLGVHPAAVLLSGSAKLKGHVDSLLGFISPLATSNSGSNLQRTASVSSESQISQASNSSFSRWGKVAAGFAAAAAIAVAASQSKTVMNIASKAKDAVSETVTSHASFLGPLWSTGNQSERIDWITSRESLRKSPKFSLIYLGTTLGEKYQQPFISLPPSSSAFATRLKMVDVSKELDDSVTSTDEIESHMGMFKPTVIGTRAYRSVLQMTLDFLI